MLRKCKNLMMKKFNKEYNLIILIIGIFSLMIYNQLIFLPKILETMSLTNVLVLSSLENLGVKKAIKFIENLTFSLTKLNFDSGDEVDDSKGKVLFLDSGAQSYKIYNNNEFNKILTMNYADQIVLPLIRGNELYTRMTGSLENLLLNNNYNYYNYIFNDYHFLSWFFKSLRKSQIEINKFDLNLMKLSFPMYYLESSETHEALNASQHLEFFFSYLSTLYERKIIIMDSNSVISFRAESDILKSQELINFSFESLVFGQSFEFENKKTDAVFDMEFLVQNQNLDSYFYDDYIFNYILASTTNCVNYDNYSNNIYLDYSIIELKKQK